VTTATAATTASAICSYPVSVATTSLTTDDLLFRGTPHIWMKTESPNSGSDIHALAPIAISAARRHADLTSSLRAAICTAPCGCVASNAPMYVRPCRERMPKAFLPRNNITNNASGVRSGGKLRV